MEDSNVPAVIKPNSGAIPYSAAVLKLWGDDDSGRVGDWFYVSTMSIEQVMFSLAPGQIFRHSDRYRLSLGADELYYVLEGTFAMANPKTGEVHVAEAGQALFFRKESWHHGFNCGTDEVRILEYLAPPGPAGGTHSYADAQPMLPFEDVRYAQNQFLGRWPMAAAEAAAAFTQQRITTDDLLWRFEGVKHPMLVGIYVSTENLTVGRAQLLPGKVSERTSRGSDTVGFVLNGKLNLFLPGEDAVGRGRSDGRWYEMHHADGFYVPADTPHQYFNTTDEIVMFMFATGSSYRSVE